SAPLKSSLYRGALNTEMMPPPWYWPWLTKLAILSRRIVKRQQSGFRGQPRREFQRRNIISLYDITPATEFKSTAARRSTGCAERLASVIPRPKSRWRKYLAPRSGL